MPTILQFYIVIVAATIVTNVVAFSVAVLWPGSAVRPLTSAARASKAAIGRIVRETQEVLVPVGGLPPTAGRGGLRPPQTAERLPSLCAPIQAIRTPTVPRRGIPRQGDQNHE